MDEEKPPKPYVLEDDAWFPLSRNEHHTQATDFLEVPGGIVLRTVKLRSTGGGFHGGEAAGISTAISMVFVPLAAADAEWPQTLRDHHNAKVDVFNDWMAVRHEKRMEEIRSEDNKRGKKK